MATVRVAILDPSGSKKTTVEVPNDVETQRLVKALVSRMNLPQMGNNGRPVSYHLAYIRENAETELQPEQTLSQAGVQDDDVLRLYAEMQAGRVSLPATRHWHDSSGGGRPLC
jgi:hypothetical protein